MEVLGMNIHKEDLDNNLEYEYNKPVMIPSTINEFSIYMKDGAKVVFSEVIYNYNLLNFIRPITIAYTDTRWTLKKLNHLKLKEKCEETRNYDNNNIYLTKYRNGLINNNLYYLL
jgi:hypothetical protein